MKEITKTRYKIYKAIKEFIEENGYSPTVRELCFMTKKNSSATIQFALDAMRRDGIVSSVKGRNRTLKLLVDESELVVINKWERE